jgi:hypothetical protein
MKMPQLRAMCFYRILFETGRGRFNKDVRVNFFETRAITDWLDNPC